MQDQTGLAHVIHFGIFEALPNERELLRSGVRVKLQDQPFRILLKLIERAGHVVTIEELADVISAPKFADSEHMVRAAVFKLRAALSDDAHSPRYIETVSHHGYRFIADLHPDAEPRQADKRRLNWILLALTMAAMLVVVVLLVAKSNQREPHSVAVLPFRDLSTDAHQDHFAASLRDLLITEFTKVKSLRVTSRTSSLQPDGDKALHEIAANLQVRYIVEGSVLRSGNRTRVSAQLVDAKTDTHIWADKYELEAQDTLAIQGEIAKLIVASVETELARTSTGMSAR